VSPESGLGPPVYVYGVVRAGAIRLPKLQGVSGRPVATIEANGLAAVTSELAQERLRVRRRDLHGHLRVLETAFAKTTVVPCAFGTVLANRESVERDLLTGRRAELLALLERLEGRVQLNVTAAYDEETVLREIVRDEPEIARQREQSRALGAAGHFASVRLGELVASALAVRRSVDAGRLLDRLAAESDDVAVEAAGDTTVLKASFLVARDRATRFDAALEELAAAEAPRLTFESIGPLPPTAFAALEAAG
jgi:Gas vesicle synthesis protein GvpL/GvpF